MPSGEFICPKCGQALSGMAPLGLCPKCLLDRALGRLSEEDTDGGEELGEGDLAASLLSGRRFGDYEILEAIASGGMGAVYKARQTRLNRIVALKLIHAGTLASPDAIKRFRTEAEAAASLDHPHIVPIYEVAEQDGQHYFSMKLIQGGTLVSITRGSTECSPDTPAEGARRCVTAARLAEKIARAVHYAHQRGVLHRDIKPGNILLDSQGEPHLTDFGLAKLAEGDSTVTRTIALLGTPSYMSPEQAAGRTKQLTTAADVYGVGAVFYELLTGQPPFAGGTTMETVRLVLDKEPRRPSLINRQVDRDLETICLKCLQKEPSSRYGSAEALAEDLERWLGHEPIQARPIGNLARLGKWVRRNPGIATLLLISSLAILGFLVGQTISSVRLNRANREVRASNVRLGRSLYESRWRQADDAARTEERSEAIAWLSYFLRENPSNSVAAARLLSMLSSYNFPILFHPPLIHEAPVVAMDFSRTGDRLATLTSGKTARLWNVESGQVEIELPHPAPLTQCFLGGENDSRLLTISSEPKARLWDLSSQHVIKEISLGPVDERLVGRSILLTRDRRQMALNVQSNIVAVLDAESGTWVAPPLSLPAEIHRFALSEDGRLLATASRSEVQLWDARSDQPLFSPVTLTGIPAALRFSEDGRWLACSSGDRIWAMSTITGAREREFSSKASAIAFVGNTETLIVHDHLLTVFNFRTGQDQGSAFGQMPSDWLRHPALVAALFSSRSTDRMMLLDPSIGRPRAEPFFHEGWISDVRFLPNGRAVATAAQDRTVRIWSVEMERADPMTLQAGGPVWEAQWSPSGERILSTSVRDGVAKMQLWDARTGKAVTSSLPSGDIVYVAAWAPDGSRFATAMSDMSARLWNGETGEAISPPLQHHNGLNHCAFSPNGEVLATAASDRTVRLWDGRTGKAIGAPLPHSDTPLRVAFSRDGHRLASASVDGTIRIWAVPDGALVLGPLHHEGTCWVAGFSPDDRLLVSASSDGTARLWDADTGQLVLPPIRHEGSVFGASFSPDGRAIATSTESGIARVWDTATGQPISEPMRHPGRVWFVKWSPDGQFLATTCTDGSARVWGAFSGHLVSEPFAHEKGKEVRRAEFSPDGQRLLTASFDGTVKIWDLGLLRPPVPVPDWLPELAESLVGKRIGARDAPVSVPGDSFQQVKQRIAQARGQHDYYTRWSKWMLEERLDRPVKPFRR